MFYRTMTKIYYFFIDNVDNKMYDRFREKDKVVKKWKKRN